MAFPLGDVVPGPGHHGIDHPARLEQLGMWGKHAFARAPGQAIFHNHEHSHAEVTSESRAEPRLGRSADASPAVFDLPHHRQNLPAEPDATGIQH